jgi:hypothetical protein
VIPLLFFCGSDMECLLRAGDPLRQPEHFRPNTEHRSFGQLFPLAAEPLSNVTEAMPCSSVFFYVF